MGTKPNVLIIFTDQQRYDTIQKMGHSHMITPNLNRLASQGCTYTNAHSTNPVCMPARHDMMTGLSGRYHGYFSNRREPIKDYGLPTLPRIFSENGYRTAGIGKLHFYPARMHHGFGELRLMEEIPVCRQDDEYAKYLEKVGLGHLQNIHGVRPHVYHIPQNAQMNEEHHGTAWVANETISWLKENRGKPFFLFSGFIHPHPPWDIPKEYQETYKDRDLPQPVPRSRRFPDSNEENPWFGDLDSQKLKRKEREAYYASITMLDKYVGRILDYLEEEGIIDNTLIIFTSDHGEMLQDKGYYSKELPYDGSVRIPFIIRYPEKFKANSEKDDFVDLYDIMPTCLDICNLEYTGDKNCLPGESLLIEEGKRDRNYQFSSYGEGQIRWVMVRNRKYKYIYRYNGGCEEMYDMVNDPGETLNLLESDNYPVDEYKNLKQRAIEYEKKLGPAGEMKGNSFNKYEAKPYHPSAHGKHHLWANMQMQYFDDRPNKERGEEFIREIEYALENTEFSGVKLNEVFNDPEWKENFKDNWNKFGTGEEVLEKLFI